MLDSATVTSALWGFLGAVVYAGPVFIACWFGASLQNAKPSFRCIVEAIMAVVAGSIMGAAFGGFVASILHQADHRAMCAAVGLFGNPIAERLVPFVRDKIMKRLDAGGSL